MRATKLPSVQYLRQRLLYDPETGSLRWRVQADRAAHWNQRYAGKEAGMIDKDGYWRLSVGGTSISSQRVIWAMQTGEWPPAEADVDHINHTRSDNRWENLRLVSRVVNMRNTKLWETSTSGVVGVSWNEARQYWYAYICVKGRTINLGNFRGYVEGFPPAVAAREAANLKYGFHENHGKPKEDA